MVAAQDHRPDLGALLREEEHRKLQHAFTRLDDVQIAQQVDNLRPDGVDAIFAALPGTRRADVFGELREETAGQMVRRLAPEEAAALLDDQETDDVADILGFVDAAQLRQILARFDPEEVQEIEDLLAYPDDSAGGIMSPDVVTVHESATAAEALRSIQALEEPPQTAFYVYVVDDDRHLTGVLTLRRLVTSSPDAAVRELMLADLVTVHAQADQEEVADIAGRYDLLSVPVVDDTRHLLGVVTIDDIVDVLREEATEDILKMAGAGEMLVDTRSFWSSFRIRVRWLLAAAVGLLIVSFALSGFEEALRQVPVLAIFMPVIAGMGGNVGTQSSTIVVRGLAVGYVERAKVSRLVLRECALGLSLGLVYGILSALAVPAIGFDLPDPMLVGVVVAVGMIGATTVAALVGASVPLIMDHFGIDPAIATGPFVTTAVDLLGLLFYFGLATALLGIE